MACSSHNPAKAFPKPRTPRTIDAWKYHAVLLVQEYHDPYGGPSHLMFSNRGHVLQGEEMLTKNRESVYEVINKFHSASGYSNFPVHVFNYGEVLEKGQDAAKPLYTVTVDDYDRYMKEPEKNPMACPSHNPRTREQRSQSYRARPAYQAGFRLGLSDYRKGTATQVYYANGEAARRYPNDRIKQDEFIHGYNHGYDDRERLSGPKGTLPNPLSRFRVTHNGQTFTVTATSKAAAERQVRAMGLGQDVEETGTRPGQHSNPVFLPKSLFDSYEVRSEAGGISALNIQTLGGAEKRARELMKKYPCVGFGIYSRKHGSLIKSYKPTVTGAGAPKVDVDNEKQYKREATKEAKAAVRFTLFIDGQEYASYETRQEAAAVGRTEGKGKSVRIKETHENPGRSSRRGPVEIELKQERGGESLWLAKQDGVVLGWLSKYKDTRTETHPYKVFSAIVGQGPVRVGSMLETFYGRSAKADALQYLAKQRNPMNGSPRHDTPVWDVQAKQRGEWVDKGEVRAATKRQAIEIARTHYGQDVRVFKTDKFTAGNPEGGEPLDPAASEMYRTFHGVSPSQEMVFEETRELPDAYAELGTLIELWIVPINSRSEKSVKITAPDPDNSDVADIVHLAASPDAKQMHLVGGDQSLDLKALGFGDREIKENMVIGIITELTYLAKKKFHKLQPTQYYHKLGEESGNQPFLLYDPHMEHMAIAGGSYLIRDVGIVD